MMRDAEDPFHEGMALDAVLRLIEERDGVKRSRGFDPEAQRHASPVDYCCTLGDELIALEHTGIEAFPGQIRTGRETSKLLDPLMERLKGFASATECFRLYVPIEATTGIKTKDVPAVRDALETWIRATAPAIEATRYGSRSKHPATARPDGVPFDVTLRRFSEAQAMGGVFCYQRVTGPVEGARAERLATSRDKKFGKLAAWKAEAGAKTILVLEDVDMWISNEQLVAETFAKIEAGHADQPDEIYVVATFVDLWHVTCLRRSGKTFWDDGESSWPVESATLSDLTGR
ncbi:MAG: hypothetical protein WCA81_08270 [Rhizomicrobium sp.]